MYLHIVNRPLLKAERKRQNSNLCSRSYIVSIICIHAYARAELFAVWGEAAHCTPSQMIDGHSWCTALFHWLFVLVLWKCGAYNLTQVHPEDPHCSSKQNCKSTLYIYIGNRPSPVEALGVVHLTHSGRAHSICNAYPVRDRHW
jgi:hypothetical protein